jgi:hypothetical protein
MTLKRVVAEAELEVSLAGPAGSFSCHSPRVAAPPSPVGHGADNSPALRECSDFNCLSRRIEALTRATGRSPQSHGYSDPALLQVPRCYRLRLR